MKIGDRGRAVCIALAIAWGAQAAEPASAPATNAKEQSVSTGNRDFVVEAEMPYRARLRTTGIFINALHLTKPTKEVVDSIRTQPSPSHVTVIVCRGPQEEAIKDFWDVSDQFIFEALFLLPDWNPPPRDTLLWPGYDHPMINYVRRIRTATQDKYVVASVPMTSREIWGVPRERPELFEELKWMTMAVIGANYQGILWGHVRREPGWNEMLQALTDQLKAHAADLGSAVPVDWVQAPSGQPVSALASQDRLFITLLNPDFMKVSEDKRQIAGALDPARRTGQLTLHLPPGIIVTAATTLDGSPLKIRPCKDGLICPYDFATGGEMVIVPITRSIATKPSLDGGGN